MKNAVVLTLHGVAPDDKNSIAGQDISAAKYTITRSTLIKIASFLKARKSCSLEEFVDHNSTGNTILTFDDGLISDYSEAFPALQDRGIKATFFITAENIGKPGYMSQSQIIELARYGMEIASHGLQHRYLVNLSESDARREIQDSREALQQLLGKPVTSFAPVGGHYMSWMIGFSRDVGYRAFATMIPGRTSNSQPGDLLVVRRNHIQSHHRFPYISSLVAGDSFLLARNQIRYSLLSVPKRIMGMDSYDRLKRMLTGGESH